MCVIIERLYSGILHVGSRFSLEYARNEGMNRARCLSFQPSSDKIAPSISLVLIIQPASLVFAVLFEKVFHSASS